MRQIQRFFGTFLLGLIASVRGAALGAMLGAFGTGLYYAFEIVSSLEPYAGSKPENIMSAIMASWVIAPTLIASGAVLGAIAHFAKAITDPRDRRGTYKRGES